MEAKNQCPKCGHGSDEAFAECPGRGAEQNPGPGYAKNKITLIMLLFLAAWGIWAWIGHDSGAGKRGARSGLRISAGERVDLAAHLAEGAYTLFLFYADW